MTGSRPYAPLVERLKQAGLRPTRQRLALAKLLFDPGFRHVTAEQLHAEAQGANVRVSLATVYNTLHRFTEQGLLREVVVEASRNNFDTNSRNRQDPRAARAAHRSYFDTNTGDHHHFYFEATGELQDVAGSAVEVARLPSPPAGQRLERVDVVIRLQPLK